MRRERAFTLVEMLVAIGAVSIIAVGLAAVFGSVGETISTGRRVSRLNSVTAAIERTMREDFRRIRRDGFLVIRNQYAGAVSGDTDPDVALWEEDASRRARRSDEIMFFASGDFATARQAIHPDMIARSNTARVYYGHGQEFRVETSLPRFQEPLVEEGMFPSANDPDSRLGIEPADGSENPNLYASDWTLLRHVTLMVPETSSAQELPERVFYWEAPYSGADLDRLRDGQRQVALQPASWSIFKSEARLFIPGDSGFGIRSGSQQDALPMPTSGIVDIATDSLPRVMTFLTSNKAAPGDPPILPHPIDTSLTYETFYSTGAGVFGQPLYLPWSDPPPAEEFAALQQVHAWMLDAMPSWTYLPHDERSRMRFHDVPPAYLFIDEQADGEPESELWRTVKLADQAMLLTPSFVPNCSEFIVEWAYGAERYDSDYSDTGFDELVWHGLPSSRTDAVPAVPDLENPDSPGNFLITPVHTPIPYSIVTLTNELVSYFMPFDPRNGATQQWPAYLRITVRVADPNDPSYEDTIQMVFPLGDQV